MMLGSQSARSEQSLDRPGKNVNVGQTERWISMAAGAALAIYGLTRESMAGKAALSIAGGYLFYRGQTGYDPLYQAFGMNTESGSSGVSIEKTTAQAREILSARKAEVLEGSKKLSEALARVDSEIQKIQAVMQEFEESQQPPGSTGFV